MKEHTKKEVSVLGIDVSVMRPDKAVNITMNYLNRKGNDTIFFHSAESSIICETQTWASDLIQSCNLVFAGDKYMEDHTTHAFSIQNNTFPSFAYAYIKRLLYRLNRDSRDIFLVMSKEDQLASLEEYFHNKYPDIHVKGGLIADNPEEDGGRVVNEINAEIPDLVFVCLPPDMQLSFMREYQNMMNTKLTICMESIHKLVFTEVETIPSWVELLHLSKLYLWIRKEGKLQQQIVGSIFRHALSSESENHKEEPVEEKSDEDSEE